MNTELKKIQSMVPTCIYQVHVGLARVPHNLEEYEVNMDPEYQRDYVWTKEQQSLFMGTLISDCRMVNPIILNFLEGDSSGPSEIVDGKQRINAVIKWIDNSIPAITQFGHEIWYENLEKADITACKNAITMQWRWVALDPEKVIQYYLMLNSGGSIHTEEDLKKAKDVLKNLQKEK